MNFPVPVKRAEKKIHSTYSNLYIRHKYLYTAYISIYGIYTYIWHSYIYCNTIHGNFVNKYGIRTLGG